MNAHRHTTQTKVLELCNNVLCLLPFPLPLTENLYLEFSHYFDAQSITNEIP